MFHISLTGAQSLTPESRLCEISCSDGDKYFIHCGLKGQLLEVKDNVSHLYYRELNI